MSRISCVVEMALLSHEDTELPLVMDGTRPLDTSELRDRLSCPDPNGRVSEINSEKGILRGGVSVAVQDAL